MVDRIGPRLTLVEQMERKRNNRGRQLSVEFYSTKGRILRANETVGRQPQDILLLSLQVDTRESIIIPQIELVTIREGLKMGKIMLTNGFYELMMKADPSLLKPLFWDDDEIGIAAGHNLPVVGIQAGWVDQILGSYNRLTGLSLVIPTIDEPKEAADKVEIGENKYGEVGQWTSDMHGRNYRYCYFLRSGLGRYRSGCNIDIGLRFAKRT